MRAVSHALQVIHWQENTPSEDMPPRWMWPFDEALSEHFKALDYKRAQERNERAGGDHVERPPLVENEDLKRLGLA